MNAYAAPPSVAAASANTAHDETSCATTGKAATASATSAPAGIAGVVRVLSGAEILMEVLREENADVIFGYPGGAVLPIYDALYNQDFVKHFLVRHEQGAAHAAEGYARSTGKVGVVLVTSGPGATNIVTGLTDALLDSIPLVAITGQVPTSLIGTDAFQECDTTGITRACTKHNYLVKRVEDLAGILREAFHIARSGRPGPVLVDLPKDIQFAKTDFTNVDTEKAGKAFAKAAYQPRRTPDSTTIHEALELMKTAIKPLFYTGGGVVNAGAGASETLRSLVRATGFPITSTLMGLGCYPTNDPLFLGMLGMHGTWEANNAMHDCDVMINVGARFDDRVTGRLNAFAPHSKKIHIDIDPSSVNKNVAVDVAIIGDAGEALKALLAGWQQTATTQKAHLEDWWAQIALWRGRKSLNFINSDTVIKPQYALKRLQAAIDQRAAKSGNQDDVYITTEVGQHQMWAAQHLHFTQPNRWLTSGGLGTMGYGLPAAIGVQVAHPKALVIDVAGEASILMNIQELGTAAQYRLPVKVFILNNEWMGMVRQWQELLHGERYSESYSQSLPDFVKLAESFHAKGLRAKTPAELDGVIAEMLDYDGTVVVDVCVDKTENCYPMIPSGHAHNEMLLGAEDQSNPDDIEAGKILV